MPVIHFENFDKDGTGTNVRKGSFSYGAALPYNEFA